MAEPGRRGSLLVAAVLTLAVAGCSGGPKGEGEAAPSPAAPAATGAPTAATATAGPLTERDVPAADSLGGQWTPDSSAEEPGHGDDPGWLSARDPVDVAAGIVPLGCAGLETAPAYPLPGHALQGRYATAAGRHAVALVLDYPTDAVAETLLLALGQDYSRCPGPSAPASPTSPYQRAVTVQTADDAALRATWTETGAGATASTWHLLGLRAGSRVGLLYVESSAGEDPGLAAAESALQSALETDRPACHGRAAAGPRRPGH